MRSKTQRSNLGQLQKGLANRPISWVLNEKNIPIKNLGAEMNSLEEFFELIRMIRFIAQIKTPVFIVTLNRSQQIVTTSNQLPEGQGSKIYKALGTTEGELQLLTNPFPLHQVSPYLDCFFTTLQNHTFKAANQQEDQVCYTKEFIKNYRFTNLNESDLLGIDQKLVGEKPCQFVADILNSLIEALQKALNDPKFKLAVRSFEKVTDDVYSGAIKYTDKLINRSPETAKLWCVRFKLWCIPKEARESRQDQKPLAQSKESRQEALGKYIETCKQTHQQMSKYRTLLFELLRKNRFFDVHRSGYVWKLEHFLSRDFHFDCLFLFEGIDKDSGLITVIEEAWQEAVSLKTELVSTDTGVMFVENSSTGITETEQLDREQYKAHIRNIVTQMVQTDVYLRIDRKFGDCFGKGQIRYRKTANQSKVILDAEEQAKAALEAEKSKARKLARENSELKKELEQLRNEKRNK